ncbi:MAG: hypothetical protein FJ090_22665 [Deltaproteobacteria bacterium]|nr:hypothetical protein [Deltaproteobacteria bacterium]
MSARACALLAAMISAPVAHAEEFRGEAGWFVIGEVVRSPREAALKVGARNAEKISVAPIATEYFTNLRRGFIALVYGVFTAKEPAVAFVAELAQKGIKTNVKESGAISLDKKGAPQRLLHVTGKFDPDAVQTPAPLEVDGERVFTDRSGAWQVWTLVGVKEAGEIDLLANALVPKKHRKECTGWFDKGHLVNFAATDREVKVDDWSPTQDCCDN